MSKRRLSVPDMHRLRIARQTIRMEPRMIPVMGGMSLAEAHKAIYELTGKWAKGGQAIAAQTFRAGNPGVPEEGPVEHLKNAAAILQANLEIGEKDALVADDARAVLARIKAALRQLEDRRVNIPLSRYGKRRSVRRGNPALAILGANPRVEDATLATWAKIEYMRPDDPDGKNIIRVHEFKDGFEIVWLSDGTVQLAHPKHPLWTEDGA